MAINFILCLPIFWACMDSKIIIWPNGNGKHCILYQKRQIGKAEFPNRSSKLFLFLLYVIKISLSIWPYNFSPINASSNYVCCVTSLHVYVVLCIQQNRVCSCLFHTQGRRNSIISGEAPQVKERTRAGNFKKLL